MAYGILLVPDLLQHDLSSITQLFESQDTQPTNNLEPLIPPPVLIPSTSRPVPMPQTTQPSKPSPLAISLPSTPTLLSDNTELTSMDNEPSTCHKQPSDKKKMTLDYVQHAALQLYQEDHIPWQKYTHHLKKKQKSMKSTVQEHHNWVTNSDTVTHL